MKKIIQHPSGTLLLFILFLLLLNWPLVTVYFSTSLLASLVYIFIVLIACTLIMFIGTRFL